MRREGGTCLQRRQVEGRSSTDGDLDGVEKTRRGQELSRAGFAGSDGELQAAVMCGRAEGRDPTAGSAVVCGRR
jgi:hypothetical protein